MPLKGRIKQITTTHSQSSCYLLEVELSGKPQGRAASESDLMPATGQTSPPSLEFTLCSEFINFLPQEVARHLLHSMTFKHFAKGERFIRQGEEGKNFYLILKGSCLVNFQKNNMLYEVARLAAGDIVGEMAVFIGVSRSAHVDAETDMDLLSMSRERFEALSREHPELNTFLSEIISHRLSTSKVIADRTIGKYIITEKIDHGGSGIVYKGVHSMLDIPVAIKMLKHDMAMHPDFIDIFRNEAKTIAQLNHPNIVKVYDIEELYRTVFITMEYLDGTSLKYMLKNTLEVPLSKILDIIVQICFGLDYAHKHGVIHQDINPQNIHIQSDGQVKIIDFGLACPPGSIDSNFLFPGTIYYISPEQIKGNPVDARTDIYSLGVTAYEMITGEKPFPGNDVGKLIHSHLEEDIPDTRSKFPDLPDALHNFLKRSMRKDPSARYQNIGEILDELLPVAAKLGVRVKPEYYRKQKVMGMFLMYDGEQQLALKSVLEQFNRDITETGATLRIAQFENFDLFASEPFPQSGKESKPEA
jgi:serine/threonine protein kinase